jgi:hypothetical protein
MIEGDRDLAQPKETRVQRVTGKTVAASHVPETQMEYARGH